MEASNYNQEQLNISFHAFAEEHELLRKKYRIKVTATKEDAKKLRGTKEGDLYERNPIIPDNPKEAFELFKNFYASIQCALQKHFFLEKYRIVNEASIKAEIKELEKWILAAKEENYSEACKGIGQHNPEHEYLRLVNGFYDGYLMTWQQHQENSTAASIYGKYVLFYDLLKNELSKLTKTNTPRIQELISHSPELRDVFDRTTEEWFEEGYSARIQMFGECSIKEHCEREILKQRHVLDKDIKTSLENSDFNTRMIHQALAKKRREYIEYIESVLEEQSYSEIPFIGMLINSNTNINPQIIDAYYSIVPQPSIEQELPENYIGKHARFNAPYSLVVEGAYVLSIDWEMLDYKVNTRTPPFDKITDKELENAHKEFGKGFRKGYYTFENDILGGENINIILVNQHYARKVYDYITGGFLGRGGYPISYGRGNLLCEWYNSGINAGKYYRGWYVIIEHYSVFEYFLQEEVQKSKVITKTKPEKELSLYIASGVKDTLFEILKEYFFDEDKKVLNELLQNPSKQIRPITIKTNGNRLADTFKQLFDADLVMNCTKKELESWIKKNFNYTNRGNVKEFKIRYLNDIISTNKDKCQNPIINVRKDKQSGQYVIDKA